MSPSVVHFGSFEEINNPEIGHLEVYGRAKLAIILAVKYGIYDRVIKKNGDHIYALSVHPGAVCTATSLCFPVLRPKVGYHIVSYTGSQLQYR